jgi:hypothetical protein
MRHRLATWIALIGLVVLPAIARPEGASDKPTIVVRLASIDSLTADVLYLADLVGQGEKAKEGLAALDAQKDRDGLKGVDTKKPLGLYGTVGPKGAQEDAVAVLLVPVTSEDAVVNFVGALRGTKPSKDADGVYSVAIGLPMFGTVYGRFTDGYCYISNTKAALDKEKLLSPADVLPAGKVGLVSATVQLDKLPKNMKDLMLSRIDLHLANARDKGKPGESEQEAKLRKLVIDEAFGQIKALLRDGAAVDLRVEVDPTAGDLGLSFSVAAKSGSELATAISDLATRKSLAASLIGRNSASSLQLHLGLPAKLKNSLGEVLDQLEKKAMAEAPDDNAREVVGLLAKAILPTLKAGELDSGFDLRGPSGSGHYTFIAGSRVSGGEAIDKAIHKVIDKVPGGLAGVVQLDAEKAGSATIHRINVPDLPPELTDVLGNSPLYIAVRDDAVLMVMGDKGLETIKELAASSARPGPIVGVTSSVGRLVPLLEKTNKPAGDAAKKALGKGDNDKVRLVIQGGEALEIKITAKGQLLKFAAAMKDKDR